GLINEKHEKNCGCSDNVENRHNWITKRLVWTLGVWPLPPQQKQSSDCENIKNQCGRNDVVEQVSIKIAVTSICFHGARQHEDSSPDPLNNEAPGRAMVFVQLTHPPEKKTVARHRIIGASAREDQSIIATERRNHNCDRHDRRSGAGKNYVCRFRCDAIARRILDRGEWKRCQISHIRQQIKSDNQKRTKRE